MFRVDVLQNQWLILALGGGVAVLFCVVLLFLALWRPRETAPSEGTVQRPSVFGWLRSFMPWLLVLVALALAAFMAVYVAGAVRRPPNW